MLRRLLQRLAAWLVAIAYNDEDVAHEENVDGDCPCGPEVNPVEREDGSIGWVYIRNALDGRDLEEQGQGVPIENPHGLLDEFDGLE